MRKIVNGAEVELTAEEAKAMERQWAIDAARPTPETPGERELRKLKTRVEALEKR